MAGVIVAIHPNAVAAIAAKSIGAPVEILAMTAFCAVISSVIVEEGRIVPLTDDPVRPREPEPSRRTYGGRLKPTYEPQGDPMTPSAHRSLNLT